jgi:peptidylprolyl isomerase/peptidyl-prolyl cis-trans isomerase B (cyclophilin B)
LVQAEQKLIVDSLADSDWRVRAAACAVLAERPEVRLSETAAQQLASLWTDERSQLAMVALAAAGVHPEAGDDARLRRLVEDGDPWLAAEAFHATARRGAAETKELTRKWLASDEEWRRRAVARSVVHLSAEVGSVLEAEVLVDSSAAVRLALLDSWDADVSRARREKLWEIVDSDPDPVVRTRALALLQGAGEPLGVDRMRSLYRRWQADTMPDAIAAALAAAVLSSHDDQIRAEILKTAADDSNPAVTAMVFAQVRREGVKAVLPERENRHGKKWYSDLVRWSDQQHWLDVVTVRGTFRIRLDSRETPITCRELVDLAKEGFYDGLTFHRVVPNFVIQGGDPRGDGWGGPGFVLPDEPSLRPFDSWRVGIATSGLNTGGCQFFVTLLPADRLTGHYTNFGEVVAGRDTLTRIQAGDRIVRVIAVEGDEPPPLTPVPIDTPAVRSK